jgi:hypothetical protein
MSEDENQSDISKQDLKVWEVALNTQMHFNELLIRSRTTVVTVAMAVIGATSIALRETNITFQVCSGKVHIGIIILCIGIVFLLAQFIIDYFYYFKLLLGAVKFTTKLDEKYKDKNLFGLTTCINDSISQKRAAGILVAYYLIPILLGLILIVLMLFCMGNAQEARPAIENLGKI